MARSSIRTLTHRPATHPGKAKAITATARKLAIIVYRMLPDRIPYRKRTAAAYDQQ